jgi:predicted pyridoxine 5'-phosphate oxidase superfamily flavin-nucleotide-binding protein
VRVTTSVFCDHRRVEAIESVPYFFLATSDAEGRPDCSFKGGAPGFVRITGPSELAFPDYDGNGMFKSLGNILVNPNVGMLFIAMHGKPQRLRVNGQASVSDRDPLLADFVAEVGFEGRIGSLMDFLKRMRDRCLSAGPRGAGALRL